MHISLLSLRMKSYPVLPARSSQAFFLLLPWVPLIFYSYFCPYLNLCVCVFKYSFIRLHQVSSCGTQDLLCSMRDLVPQSGKEPRLPHWEFRDPVTDPAGKSLMCVFIFSSVRVRLFATPWIAACQASLSITNSRSSSQIKFGNKQLT